MSVAAGMQFKFKGRSPWLVLSVLMLMPSIFLLWRARDTQLAIETLLQSMLLWAALVVAIQNWRALVVVCAPMLFLLPGELFFIYVYGYPSTRHVIALLFETSAAETLEFLSGLWGILAISAAVVGSFFFLLWRSEPEALREAPRWRIGAIAVLLAVSLGHDVLRKIPSVPLAVRQYTWANSYPAGVFFRVAGFVRGYWQGKEARSRIEQHRFGATTDAARMTVILVIGESARPDHWSLGGYARNTNPKLGEQQGITFLGDLVTPWALTRYAVPTLLTRKAANDASVFPEKSLLGAFAEAGYETFWFANQDGIEEVKTHVAEAAVKKSFNLSVGRGDVDAAFDGVMLDDIRHALARQSARKLIVIHTKGSHWDYFLRYPREYAEFLPDAVGGKSGKYDAANRQVLVNAYDNSIRYTDYFLSELVDMMRNAGGPAALVYVSDHGQGLYDNGCEAFGHGNDLEQAFRPAALVWTSSAWIEKNQGAASALKKNSRVPATTAQTVFNTVADFGALNIVAPEHSILRERFSGGQRLVNVSAGQLDFDRSSRSGVCRYIVPAMK